MIRVLRLTESRPILSARFFDDFFIRALAPDVSIQPVDQRVWLQDVLGPIDAPWPFDVSRAAFARATKDRDYLFPNHTTQTMSAWFLALRNAVQAPTRLLFLAHSPGATLMEWLTMRPLLRPGDRIIAPSLSAKEIILFLCPDLAPWVRVIHHPMDIPGAPPSQRRRDRIVTLTRIRRDKLIHRQIDAMALVTARRPDAPPMIIAGARADDEGRIDPYVRTLEGKIQRLGLQEKVTIADPITDEDEKRDLLSRARVAVCLSASLEEAFPKASVEALAQGAPVVATRWNGLVETVGPCGVLTPLVDRGPGMVLDVAPGQVARAIESALDHPPSQSTMAAHVAAFAAGRIRSAYHDALSRAMIERDAAGAPGQEDPFRASGRAVSGAGLISHCAPLSQLTWGELFAAYADSVPRLRCRWQDEECGRRGLAEALSETLTAGCGVALARFMAGLHHRPWSLTVPAMTPTGNTPPALPDSELDLFVRGVQAAGTAPSRRVCLARVLDQLEAPVARRLVDGLRQVGGDGHGMRYLEGRMALLSDQPELAAALGAEMIARDGDLATAGLRLLARACRAMGRPHEAVEALTHWLRQYPDEPDTPSVWVDLCQCCVREGAPGRTTLRWALAHARSLSGAHPVLDRLEKQADRSDGQ